MPRLLFALTRQRLPHEPAEESSQITRAGNSLAYAKVSGWSYLCSQVHPAGEEDSLMTEVRPSSLSGWSSSLFWPSDRSPKV